ncbi:MAG: hypothetical protein JWO58_1198, partial [Chitinophagaceae bacterium]|nr:hypothetical protein [Chitinophagaceae bacterium]
MKVKYFLLFLVLVTTLLECTNTHAQDIVDLKEQYDKGIASYNSGNYAAAISVLEEILPEVEKVYQDTASYFNLLNTLGDACVQQEAFPKAKLYFYKAWKEYGNMRKAKYLEYGLFSAVSLGNIYQAAHAEDSAFYFYQKSIVEWDRWQGE